MYKKRNALVKMFVSFHFNRQDYNITEKPYKKSRRMYGRVYSKGEKMIDVRMLCAEQTTLEWIDLNEFKERKCQKPFRKLRQPAEHAVTKIGNDSSATRIRAK